VGTLQCESRGSQLIVYGRKGLVEPADIPRSLKAGCEVYTRLSARSRKTTSGAGESLVTCDEGDRVVRANASQDTQMPRSPLDIVGCPECGVRVCLTQSGHCPSCRSKVTIKPL
jgi:hypothetical protein